MKYRAEIDGLRALAVVPVILFHAGFELFSGGFVGVDVFFVISGYLITTILVEDIENKRFSIVNFYERRARRILPALFVVMLLCIPFAWMWMLPSQMKDFSQSLVAVSLFASNILFWREGGYFDTAAEEKPLLHTWSLAVEEQYYVMFPIFLILAWRFGKNRVFWMIVVMAAISLLFSEWGWRNRAKANFYLAPTRAWELFAGSIAAFIVQKKGVQKNNSLALVGLAAIVFSIFVYDETTPFPSVYALVPVLGVMLLVLYADKETLAAKLLSTRGFVGIGLVSYSAYLWHQPLFAFTRIRMIDDPSHLVMLFLCATSILLGYFSWRFIEKPFRNRSKISRRQIFSASFALVLIPVLLGLNGHINDGFKSRFATDLLKLDEINSQHVKQKKNNICNVHEYEYLLYLCEFGDVQNKESIRVAFVGDSHASALVHEFNSFFENKGVKFTQFTKNGCPSIPKWEVNHENNCPEYTQRVVEYLQLNDDYDYVILASRWSFYLNQQKLKIKNNESTGNAYTIEALRLLTQSFESFVTPFYKKLIIIGQAPEVPFHVPQRLAKMRLFDEAYDGKKFKIVLNDSLAMENFSRSHKVENLTFIDVKDLLCSNALCKIFEDDVLYYDDDHLSNNGAAMVAAELEKELMRLR